MSNSQISLTAFVFSLVALFMIQLPATAQPPQLNIGPDGLVKPPSEKVSAPDDQVKTLVDAVNTLRKDVNENRVAINGNQKAIETLRAEITELKKNASGVASLGSQVAGLAVNQQAAVPLGTTPTSDPIVVSSPPIVLGSDLPAPPTDDMIVVNPQPIQGGSFGGGRSSGGSTGSYKRRTSSLLSRVQRPVVSTGWVSSNVYQPPQVVSVPVVSQPIQQSRIVQVPVKEVRSTQLSYQPLSSNDCPNGMCPMPSTSSAYEPRGLGSRLRSRLFGGGR